MSVTAIVLCGGRSVRMGQDKGSLAFGAESMLERVTRILGAISDGVMRLLDQIQTKRVDAAVFRDLDPDLETFISVDTPEKYAAAVARLSP